MPLHCNALITRRWHHFPHLAQTQVSPQPSAMPCRKSSYVFHAFTDVSSTSNFDQTQVCSCLISRGRWCRNTTSKWPTNMLVVCAPHCPHVCISLINFEDRKPSWRHLIVLYFCSRFSRCNINSSQFSAWWQRWAAGGTSATTSPSPTAPTGTRPTTTPPGRTGDGEAGKKSWNKITSPGTRLARMVLRRPARTDPTQSWGTTSARGRRNSVLRVRARRLVLILPQHIF